jgi:Icc protein
MNFYKSRSSLARVWSERSRQEILGFWPQFAFGNTVADRNTVVPVDLSGLHRRHHRRHPHDARTPGDAAAPSASATTGLLTLGR